MTWVAASPEDKPNQNALDRTAREVTRFGATVATRTVAFDDGQQQAVTVARFGEVLIGVEYQWDGDTLGVIVSMKHPS